jgi:hypothetical protein
MENLFSDLSQILPYIAAIQQKIEYLKKVRQCLDDSDIFIWICSDENCYYLKDGSETPFNMKMEIRNLIEDSIDEYQRQIVSLNSLANENNI